METQNVTQSMLQECTIIASGRYESRIVRAGKNPNTKAAQYALSKLPIDTGAWSKALAYADAFRRDKQLQTGMATLLKAGKARCLRVNEAHPETPTTPFHYRFEKV